MLGVLCAFFPKEGVELGPVELRFASLEDFLPAEPADTLEEPQESPEELLARRVMELRQAEESEFLDYFEHSDARIQFPGDDLSLFDPFFRALDSASVHPLRILHYGDSQIEEDRISNNIRKSFQARFGGNGIGLMPLVQSYPTLTSSQRRSSTAPSSTAPRISPYRTAAGASTARWRVSTALSASLTIRPASWTAAPPRGVTAV